MSATGKEFYGPGRGYDVSMKVITGKVVDGKVELPPGVLDEGESVAILALDDAEPVVLSPEEQRELTDRLEAIARGDYIDGDEFL